MSDEPQEIERSYLLRGLPELPAEHEALEIEQGYLPDPPADGGDGVVEGRLRRTRYGDGRVVCKHTIKKGEGLVRSEVERTITEDEFEAEWPRTHGRRLEKVRYKVPAWAFTWEVDAFKAWDLVLAEVELPSVDAVAPIPSWLEGWIVREVTDEPAFRNYRLALSTHPPR